MKNMESLVELHAVKNRLKKLPPKLTSASKLTRIDAQYNNIASINKVVYGAPIDQLNLANNRLKGLPKIPAKGKCLIHHMNVSSNEISALPDNIGQLACLTSLDLSHNSLTGLPQSFGGLKYLRTLNLAYNRLATLPEFLFGAAQALANLNVSNNVLETLPDDFNKFVCLDCFDASCNSLQAFLDLKSNMKSLRWLNMSSNKIKDVHNIIFLPNCATVNVASNEIESLPEDIERAQSLITLDISDNKIVCLPENIGQIRTLKNLLASNNQLKALPSMLGSEQCLVTLDLTGNALEGILADKDMRRLRTVEKLLLSKNRLTSLSRAVENLMSVEKLDVSENQMSTFFLPHSTKELVLSRNPLMSLEEDPKYSPFAIIYNDSFVRSITVLELVNTRLDEIPVSVCKLRMLTSLDVSFNTICELPDRMPGGNQ